MGIFFASVSVAPQRGEKRAIIIITMEAELS